MTRSDIGFAAEQLAKQFLINHNYKIIGQNYRRPWGEIDIIAQKEGITIFVEVKANTAQYKAYAPELRAGFTKLKKVIRTARTYLMDKKYKSSQPWQIDVISIIFDKTARSAQIKHFKNIEI
ncbi:MAG TPA: YraN family protein [Candidatus Paceibacterota bacterium]|nr:YraN family protein [Candidatus Paceibacterota bacterium]